MPQSDGRHSVISKLRAQLEKLLANASNELTLASLASKNQDEITAYDHAAVELCNSVKELQQTASKQTPVISSTYGVDQAYAEFRSHWYKLLAQKYCQNFQEFIEKLENATKNKQVTMADVASIRKSLLQPFQIQHKIEKIFAVGNSSLDRYIDKAFFDSLRSYYRLYLIWLRLEVKAWQEFVKRKHVNSKDEHDVLSNLITDWKNKRTFLEFIPSREDLQLQMELVHHKLQMVLIYINQSATAFQNKAELELLRDGVIYQLSQIEAGIHNDEWKQLYRQHKQNLANLMDALDSYIMNPASMQPKSPSFLRKMLLALGSFYVIGAVLSVGIATRLVLGDYLKVIATLPSSNLISGSIAYLAARTDKLAKDSPSHAIAATTLFLIMVAGVLSAIGFIFKLGVNKLRRTISTTLSSDAPSSSSPSPRQGVGLTAIAKRLDVIPSAPSQDQAAVNRGNNSNPAATNDHVLRLGTTVPRGVDNQSPAVGFTPKR